VDYLRTQQMLAESLSVRKAAGAWKALKSEGRSARKAENRNPKIGDWGDSWLAEVRMA
jgi:hypothetical protein